MARPPASRPPGWYRDPEDPTCVRHWAGDGWSNRRRLRPSWDLPDSEWVAPPLPGDTGGPVLDGPARSPGLSAMAAAATGRARPQGVADGGRRIRPSGPRAAGPRTGAPRVNPAPSLPMWNGGRRPLAIVLGVVFLAVAAMAASVAFTRPLQAIPWSLDDPQFLSDANQLCASGLPGARPPAAPAMTARAAVPSPAQLTSWAAAVDRLALRISSLPSRPDDVVRLNGWLDNWRAYGADETRYAAWLASERSPSAAGRARAGASIAAQVQSDARRADAFAVSSGLDACTLNPTAATAR